MILHFVDDENMWTDVQSGLKCIFFSWGGEDTNADDFYYEWYL